jgi:rifampicin phosphotransferase
VIRSPYYTQSLFECRDTALAGGKAVNLGRLGRAGFPVPNGFVITTRAYNHARSINGLGNIGELPSDVAEEVASAYKTMGKGPVAVRSSATAEDMAAASMAGQYETFLNIDGEPPLLDAVLRCWASLDSPRIRAYLRERDIDPSQVAMAVVVQRLVSAEVAGVLFTSNPHDCKCREMLVEASWGLGESVVSGRVQPDVLRIEEKTGRVLAAAIADKRVQLSAGSREEQPVEESCRRRPCLGGRDVHRLWQLGKRAVEHFGSPQDIEWAIHADQVYLLQSRPITTLNEAEDYEELLRLTRQKLRQDAADGRGPWVLHNLAETLPHPTPLTWSLIRHFMSGAGGFGAMYRQAGFEPSPTVCREGFLDPIAGRIYMDASRAPDMFFENFPFAYDPEDLKRNPDASQTPPTLPRGSLRARLKAAGRLAAVNRKLNALSANLDRQLRDVLFPGFAHYVAEAKEVDLQSLSVERFIELWRERERCVLDEFAPRSLLPGLIGGMALAELRAFLAENFWEEDPDALCQLISSGGPPNRTVAADAKLYEVAQGCRPLDEWLTEHGHRAAGEFDLAAPRWREQPEAAREMANLLTAGESPLERHQRNCEAVDSRVESLRKRLSRPLRKEFDRIVDLLRRYMAFREDGKDFLMLGYDLLRDAALEAGRRLDIGQDVFFLTREDIIDSLRVGFAPHHLIEQRKAAYRTESRLKLPRAIDENSIDSLGDGSELKTSGGGHKAFAISPGEAAGPARVVLSPTEAGELGRGYVLVCPSTDPSWTPLFVNAAALVLECGGTLSHGAVVAREMGLPAVVLPDATQLFHNGQRLGVNGNQGWVGIVAEQNKSNGSPRGAALSVKSCGGCSSLSTALDVPAGASRSTPCREPAAGAAAAEAAAADPSDTHIDFHLLPPPPGVKDRRAAKIRNSMACIWTVFLLAFFLLPASWVYLPTLAALDWLLWPIVRNWGKPAVVAVVAVCIALVTLLAQKILTDNRRLSVAKRRAAALVKLANELPPDSRRRWALLSAAAPVQIRSLMAAMAPVGIFLGPMVMPFVWFQQRIDPAVSNPPAGSAVQIVATVSGDWSEPVRIDAPPPMVIDEATPRTRTLLPIRQTLEHLLELYRQPASAPNEPWELRAVPDVARERTADDLRAYLDAGVPPQGVTWLLRPPENYSGRFTVEVVAGDSPPAAVEVAIGDECPPVPSTVGGPAGSPVKQLKVAFAQPKTSVAFWQPFSFLAGRDYIPFSAALAALGIGWLWMYIIVYLPVLMISRAVLRVA